MLGVSDRAGSRHVSRWRHAGCGLPPSPTASAPRRSAGWQRDSFAAEYPAYAYPCQRFADVLADADA